MAPKKPLTKDEIDRQLAIEAKRRALAELAGKNDPEPVTIDDFKKGLKEAPGNIGRGIQSGYSTAKTGTKKFIDEYLTTDSIMNRLKPKPKLAEPNSLKKGGKVKKTGMALVHKGEVVLTAKQAKKMKPAKPPTPKTYPKKTVFVAATKATKGRKA